MRDYLNRTYLGNFRLISTRPQIMSPVEPISEKEDEVEMIHSQPSGVIPGLLLVENFLTRTEEKNLVQTIDNNTWSTALRRFCFYLY